jgi:hypothetical protein
MVQVMEFRDTSKAPLKKQMQLNNGLMLLDKSSWDSVYALVS